MFLDSFIAPFCHLKKYLQFVGHICCQECQQGQLSESMAKAKDMAFITTSKAKDLRGWVPQCNWALAQPILPCALDTSSVKIKI